MADLQFNAAAHQYTKDGVLVPNVTGVLEPIIDYAGVPSSTLEFARALGTAVHIATELDDGDDLVEESVDPAVRPYLDAWRKFRHDTGFIPTSIEEQVFSSRHWYAGTLDRQGPSPENGDDSLIDIKTTSKLMPSTGPQLAAYMEAKNYRKSNKIKRRYAVQLKPDGTYRLQEYADKADFSVFLACLTLHNWSTNHD